MKLPNIINFIWIVVLSWNKRKVVSCLSILIHNKDSFEHGLTNEPLTLSITIDPSDNLSVYDVEKSQFCMMANGRICQCFYDTSLLRLFPACIPPDWKHLWFSVLVKTGERNVASTPILLKNKIIVNPNDVVHMDLLSLVLPLTVDDLSRSTVLFESLVKLPYGIIKELLVFVPDHQALLLTRITSSVCESLTFPCKVYSEDVLFEHGYKIQNHTYTYGIQMAIKLLAAKMITTNFYLTLDADVILLRPFNFSQIVDHQSNRAIYRFESRSVHEHWWRGSESFLHFSSFQSSSKMVGFGVTPAVLSTYGSLLALGRMHELYCQGNVRSSSTVVSDGYYEKEYSINEVNEATTWEEFSCSAYLNQWLDKFGHNNTVWSEYTMYRLTLEYYEVFHHLHVREDEFVPSTPISSSSSSSSSSSRLHCHDVWFADAPPWDPFLAASSGCLFSVVQSTARISVSKLLQACKSSGICPQ